MRLRALGGAAGGLALAAVAPALAHHSRAAFDTTQEILIEGTIAEVVWRNPHIYLTIDTTGADGATLLQEVEVGPPSAVQTYGLTRDDLPEGAAVTVRAWPNRRGQRRTVLGLDLTMADGVIHALAVEGRSTEPRPAAAEAGGIAGNWVPNIDDFAANLRRMESQPPRLTEAGLAAMARTRAAGPAAWTADCAPGVPLPLVAVPTLRTITIDEDEVTMRFDAEGVDTLRTAHLGMTAHPEGVEPSLQGHSIAWWEGETLVIDTIAYAPHPAGIVPGLSSGPDKRTVERLTLAEDRRHLRYEITVEDPLYLAEPLVMSALWDHRPELTPSDAACDVETARRFLEEEQQ